jgi:hypothetical protein
MSSELALIQSAAQRMEEMLELSIKKLKVSLYVAVPVPVFYLQNFL